MVINIKGQALMESLWCLPLFLGFLSVLFISFTQFFNHYLADHFVYISALCLVKEDTSKCKNQLKENLNLIPFSKHQILSFYENQKQVEVKVQLTSIGNYSNLFTEKFELPLQSKHFREAQ